MRNKIGAKPAAKTRLSECGPVSQLVSGLMEKIYLENLLVILLVFIDPQLLPFKWYLAALAFVSLCIVCTVFSMIKDARELVRELKRWPH